MGICTRFVREMSDAIGVPVGGWRILTGIQGFLRRFVGGLVGLETPFGSRVAVAGDLACVVVGVAELREIHSTVSQIDNTWVRRVR